MARTTDVQVKRLFRLLEVREPLASAAVKSGMDRKTARRYRDMGKLPSEIEQHPRDWRTRANAFDCVWDEVVSGALKTGQKRALGRAIAPAVDRAIRHIL